MTRRRRRSLTDATGAIGGLQPRGLGYLEENENAAVAGQVCDALEHRKRNEARPAHYPCTLQRHSCHAVAAAPLSGIRPRSGLGMDRVSVIDVNDVPLPDASQLELEIPARRRSAGESVGMISVWGKTYRIVYVRAGTYDAVRLLDDVRVGSFDDGPPVSLEAPLGSEPLLRQIAQTAMRAAKTRWTG